MPLTEAMLSELSELPRGDSKAHDHAFSRTGGRTSPPSSSFSKPKARIDRLMVAELGEAPPHWTLHDIRRTVRTRLSALRVPDHVAEAVIGHGRKGLARVYDLHRYVDEMREALEKWNALLRSLVMPPPANVVPLRA